jgi:crotonobetainyl-CoA:carnitine CoA-transferase CaiB-like acyl-CoA transferase
LADFSILELPGDVSTRYCGRLFAQLGARVVKLGGEDDRRIGYAGEAGEAFGRWLDAGKVSNDAPAGAFDLVIAGQDRAAVAEAESLIAGMKARPVLLALCWFDPNGPYADWHATDEVMHGLTGAIFTFGAADGPPMLPQAHAPQIMGGLVGFNGALAALLEQPEKRPKRVDVNVLEAATAFVETGVISGLTTPMPGMGKPPRLGVNRFVPTYPCASYQTSDGWVGITALTPAQWQGVCKMIERPDAAVDPRFTTAIERLQLGDEVDALMRPAILKKTTDEWVKIGDAHRVPTAPVHTPAQLPTVPHWEARGAFGPIAEGDVTGPTLPFRWTFDGVTSPRWTPGKVKGPLSGLKVLDFSMGWAGPLCTRTLGDLGAEVIKIESEHHFDWWRGWEADMSGDPPPTEVRLNFIAVNRNKRGILLELTTPEGQAKAKAMIAWADVVVENFAAGVLDKLGLGQDVQRAIKPGIVSLSMPAFGNGGPLSGLRAYGSTVEQASGLPHINGEADWAPCMQHVAYGDPVAGLYGVAAVLAALAGRERLGGAEIDLAQVSCLFQLGADAIVGQQVMDGPLPRTGHSRARLELSTVVEAQEPNSWMVVAVDGPRAREGLARVLNGKPLADWARGVDVEDGVAQLQAAGVPAGEVRTGRAIGQDPQHAMTDFFPVMERRYVGRHYTNAAPFRFDGKRPELRRTAPTLGEHTDEVLKELELHDG